MNSVFILDKEFHVVFSSEEYVSEELELAYFDKLRLDMDSLGLDMDSLGCS